jgi:hypothetical protein
MPSSPRAAIQQHLEAVNAADRDQLSATTMFPLFQGLGDGEKRWYATADEVPFPVPPNRFEIVSEEIWATTRDLVLFSLMAQILDPADAPLRQIHMLWSVHRVDDEWMVGWRQLLGEV